MNNLAPVTLTYRQLLQLERCGVSSIADVAEQMADVLGDTAPMYNASFTVTDNGDTRVFIERRKNK